MNRLLKVAGEFSLALILIAGCSKTSTPEGVVHAFFKDVNKGNTESAKAYFSGEWANGYDQHDKAMLERNFPAGSIKNVAISNVRVVGESASLTATIERMNAAPYTANLSLVKMRGGWKISYNGHVWPFEAIR